MVGIDTKYSPTAFRYNGRIAAALLPSLVVLAGFGGKVPVGVALVGAMLSYILDASRVREGALAAVWVTLGGVNLGMWASGAVFSLRSPIALSLLIAVCVTTTLFTTGAWATLQFKWMQLRYPVVVLALEKLVLATTFSTAATVQAWGLTAAVGAAAAPFYLAPLLCLLFHMLACPLSTSFRVRGATGSAMGGKRSRELQIQAPLEGATAAAELVLLPASLYCVVHWNDLRAWEHLWSVLLLLGAPLFYLSCLEEGLWWFPVGDRRRRASRRLICLVALAGGLAGLEGRLIFPAFGQYIRLPPPWNFAAVTLALYGSTALAAMHLTGMLSEATGSMLASTALLLSGGLGGIAAGMPLLLLTAPFIAAGGLGLYYESRLLRDYLLFVAGAAFTTAWFIYHHFWFLDIYFQGTSLRSVCMLLWLAALFAALLPGLIAAKAPRGLTSTLFILEGGLLTALEEHLYLGAGEVGGEMYPAAMVVATSGLGALVTHRLRASKRVSHIAAWLLHCIFACKLSMLLLPQGHLPLPLLALALSSSAPVLLLRKPGSLPPWAGLAAALAVCGATWASRHSVHDVLDTLGGGPPSDATTLGALVVVAAGGSAPMLMSQPAWKSARRLGLQVAAGGLMLLLLQPPFPARAGCSHWLCFHGSEDVALWAEAGGTEEGWTLWMLVAAGMAAAAATGTGADSLRLGPSLAAGGGIAAGVYLAFAFFPDQPSLQASVGVATVAVAGVLVVLRLGQAASPALLGLLLTAWGVALLLGLLLQAVLPLPELPPEAARFFPDATALVDRDRFWANRAALVAVLDAEALLLAFAMKLRMSAGAAGWGAAAPQPGSSTAAALRVGNALAGRAAEFLGQCLPDVPGSRQPSGILRGASLAADGPSWLPLVANFVTLGCFALGVELNLYFAQNSALGILLLAPVLLLLNKDGLFLSSLESSRRYSPPVLAASLLVGGLSLSDAVSTCFEPGSSALRGLTALWLIAASAPSHLCCNQYLWTRRSRPGSHLAAAAVLALLALLAAEHGSARVFAGSGLIMCCVQTVAMRQMQQDGMKLI